MTSPNRIFRTKSLEFESEKPMHPKNDHESDHEFRRGSHELRDQNQEFSTASSTGEHLSCSARVHQSLRLIGYDNTSIRDTLHTVDVLRNLANRPVDTVLFASIRERNRLGLGAMASIASICTLPAADTGVTLRSAARFYARHKSQVDIDTMERFVKWLIAKGEKGEPITGMPSEWLEYCRLTGRRIVASNQKYRGFRSAARKPAERRSFAPRKEKHQDHKAAGWRFFRRRN